MSDSSPVRPASLYRTSRVAHRPNRPGDPSDRPGGYQDRRRLSYAGTFDGPVRSAAIRATEAVTGRMTLQRLIRRFEERGVPSGQAFWAQALDVMGIELRTPDAEIARIPAEGPLVVVANHPHGLVDGMILAEIVGRRRTDYKILARSLLTGVPEVEQFLIPVPFPHEAGARARNLEMRSRAMRHLERGGAVVLFPSGAVATSRTAFGPVIEAEWTPFTARMIRRSGARVVPVFFPGTNSRWYQIANRISPTLRQGLLLHEIVHALNRPQAPRIGHPLEPRRIEDFRDDPRGFVAWLRDATLALGR